MLTSLQEEISQARAQIEELESQNASLREANESLQTNVSRLSSTNEQQAQEIASLRSRASLSQQNWIQERDDLIQREAYAREEFENAKQAMQDWEVLAMEERSLRENLSERVAELEEQLSIHREAYEKVAAERDSQNLTVDGLQRALQDIQDGILIVVNYLDLADVGFQHANRSSANSSRTPRPNSKSYENRYKQQKRPLPQPKRH